jgi:hypothetical protein
MDNIATTDIPVPLYHYTSQSGLLGIVNHRCIWATNVKYLSDSREFFYARDLVQKEVQKLLQGPAEDEIEFLAKLDGLVSSSTRGVSIFTCSFSKKGDLLSQWNGYCPGGNGYSIGFNLQHIEMLLAKQDFILAPCIYKKSEQLKVVHDLIDRYLAGYHNQSQKLSRSARISASLQLFSIEFLKMAPRLKHPAFAQENEWRLISGPIHPNDNRLKYREGKSMLVPYIEVKLAEEATSMYIHEVIVGPTPHRSLARQSLHGLFNSQGVIGPSLSGPGGSGMPDIKLSRIPYRSW